MPLKVMTREATIVIRNYFKRFPRRFNIVFHKLTRMINSIFKRDLACYALLQKPE
jgi:hypothetical protein